MSSLHDVLVPTKKNRKTKRRLNDMLNRGSVSRKALLQQHRLKGARYAVTS